MLACYKHMLGFARGPEMRRESVTLGTVILLCGSQARGIGGGLASGMVDRGPEGSAPCHSVRGAPPTSWTRATHARANSTTLSGVVSTSMAARTTATPASLYHEMRGAVSCP